MDGGGARRSSARRRLLDWAWGHPRAKRRLREAWGIGRELASGLGLPRPFDPPEFDALRRLAASSKPAAAGAPRVLFLSWRGWSSHLAIEAVLGHAVMRAGGAPVFAHCGGRLPICDVMPVDAAPPMPCHSCREYAAGSARAAGFDSLALKDVLDVDASVGEARQAIAGLRTVADCESFAFEGLPLGRLVRISTAWFLSRGTLDETPEVLRTYRRFLVSGITVARGLRALLERVRPDRLFMLNGTFFAENIAAALATERGIPFATYEKGFIHDAIVLTPQTAACYLMPPEEAWEEARHRPLSDAEAEAVDAYLGHRRRGGDTLDNFWRNRVDDVARVRADLALQPGRPLVVMFCNILWDSAVLEQEIAFTSTGEWVTAGIRWAQRHPEVDLVVRIHPAEIQLVNHPSRERMAERIAADVPELPANVRVVDAASPISSYVLMDEAALVLVYTSTVGLEAAARGVPVVVAARTHYRGRGFTVDPVSAEEHWRRADELLASPPGAGERESIRVLACRYAALFFFRFHQLLDAVHEEGRSSPRVTVTRAADLDPGRDAVVDRLVLGILEGVTPVGPPGETGPPR